jgi:hypothetical protein
MTFRESTEIVGKKVDITLDGLTVRVKILDVKTSYGNLRFRVSAGLNSKWIDARRVG